MLNRFKDYFGFTKKELNGLFVFCVILVLIAISPVIYSYLFPPKVYNYKDFENEIKAFRASAIREKERRDNWHKGPSDYVKAEPAYFRFNPNGLSEGKWKRLGLTDKQISVIKNFESKGGRFYKKEDLQKIYSISREDYNRLEPYIDIPEKFNGYSGPKFNSRTDPGKMKELIRVDINAADSSEFEKLKGIGPAFSARIIKYRNRLGGFYKKEQLMEVYGLDSAKYALIEPQLVLSSSAIQKLHLNTINFEQMKRHPYLSYKQMNAILQYRRQHGPYNSINDLRRVVILTDDAIRRIEPYCDFSK